MKKYWIIVDGNPQGPFSPEELAARSDFSASLPVWYNGLPDWTTVDRLAELAALLPAAVAPEEPVMHQQPRPEPQPQSAWVRMPAQPAEPCPATNLGWNIAATLCCCLPAGIIGIIFSMQVQRRWMQGDIEGARKASDNAAWCFMISVVLALVIWPFQMLFI